MSVVAPLLTLPAAQQLWSHVYGDMRGRICIMTGRRRTAGNNFLDGVEESYFAYPDEADVAAQYAARQSSAGREVYYCAHLLTRDKRTKDAAADVCTLYADVDNGTIPDDFPPPSALVESSPGRPQAYWGLTRAIPAERAEELNKRIAATIGADMSGWDISQVLRIPDTANYKYAGAPTVRLLTLGGDLAYDPDQLDIILPALSDESDDDEDDGGDDTPVEFKQISPPLTDDEIISLAGGAKNKDKFLRLFFEGSISEYVEPKTGRIDPNRADLALVAIWTFYTQNLAQVDRLFRRSAIYRPEKWGQRAEYRLRTFKRALKDQRNFYEGPGDRWGGVPAGSNGHGNAGDIGKMGEANPNDLPLTDDGNARRLVRKHGNDLRYSYERSMWLTFDGKRWRFDNTGEVERRAKSVIRDLYMESAEAAKRASDKEAEALARHALRSQNGARIREMVRLAQSEPGVAITLDQLDADPWLLNVANGTINLKTGDLQPHNRNQLLTRLAPVKYDIAAECPRFEEFIRFIMIGDTPPDDPQIRDAKEALVRFMKRMAGYCATGDTSERVIFILFGTGANGKSTWLDIMRSILGDYSMRTPTETLLTRRDGTIPNDVARLKGARFVYAAEADEGKRLAEALIKDLTGGDVLSARFMRGEWFDFVPEFKLVLATNHKPVISGTDNAIWDRIKLIPFSVTIPKEQRRRKHELMAEFMAEAPGILRWIVEGCQEWLKNGLGEADEVEKATRAYKSEMDTTAAFIFDCCAAGTHCQVKNQDLYDAYRQWSKDRGERAESQVWFTRRLMEKGLEKKRSGSSGANVWFGIGLTDVGLELKGLYQLKGTEANSSINVSKNSHMPESGKQLQKSSVGANPSVDLLVDDDGVGRWSA